MYCSSIQDTILQDQYTFSSQKTNSSIIYIQTLPGSHKSIFCLNKSLCFHNFHLEKNNGLALVSKTNVKMKLKS